MESPSSWRRFFSELKRRNVYRVAVAYVAVAFVGLQAVDLLVPATTLPPWADELLIALAVFGFPLSLVLAWAYEVTPAGVHRSASAGGEQEGEEFDQASGSRSRTAVKASIGLAVVGATVAATWYMVEGAYQRDRDPPVAELAETRLAVFPFEVQGSAEARYLGEGVMTLLSEAVDGLGELRRVDPLALMSRLRRRGSEQVDPEAAGRIARHFGARRYVLGTVVELGSGIQVSALLYDLGHDAEPIADAAVRGNREDLPALTRALTQQLLATVRLGPGARLRSVGTIEAANWPAVRAYLQGEAFLRRARHDSAVEKFREAVSADSTFALAWYRLSMADRWVWSFEDRHHLDAAMHHRERLSERDRLLVEAVHAFWSGRGRFAEQRARTVVGTYPGHTEGWYWLGETRYWYAWQLGSGFRLASDPLEHALSLDPDFFPALFHASNLSLLEGRWDHARVLIERFPPFRNSWVFKQRTQQAFGSGDREEQRRLIRQLQDENDYTQLVTGFGLIQADSLHAVRPIWSRLAGDPDRSDSFRSSALIHLAMLEVARGRWEEARAAFDRAASRKPAVALATWARLAALPSLDLPETELRDARDRLRGWAAPEPGRGEWTVVSAGIPRELQPWIREYGLGLLSARLGDMESAERRARQLEEASSPSDTMELRNDLAREIRALAALEAGRPGEALSILDESRAAVTDWRDIFTPLYRRPLTTYLRAECLRQLDSGEEALAWYEALLQSSFNDYVLMAPTYLRMAQIHEDQGQPERAVGYYRRFVAHWRHADPHLQPLVTRAREQIAMLSASHG